MEFVECALLRNGCLTCLDGHGGHPVGLHVCYQVVQAPHSSDRWVVQPMGANHPVAVRMEHMRMGRRLSESAQWGALAMQTLWLTVQTKTVGLRREHQAIFKRSIEKCNSIFNAVVHLLEVLSNMIDSLAILMNFGPHFSEGHKCGGTRRPKVTSTSSSFIQAKMALVARC